MRVLTRGVVKRGGPFGNPLLTTLLTSLSVVISSLTISADLAITSNTFASRYKGRYAHRTWQRTAPTRCPRRYIDLGCGFDGRMFMVHKQVCILGSGRQHYCSKSQASMAFGAATGGSERLPGAPVASDHKRLASRFVMARGRLTLKNPDLVPYSEQVLSVKAKVSATTFSKITRTNDAAAPAVDRRSEIRLLRNYSGIYPRSKVRRILAEFGGRHIDGSPKLFRG